MSSFFKKPEPLMVKHLNKLKPYYKIMPRLEDMSLTRVLNSEVTCRVCRGQRMVYVKSNNGMVNKTHCLFCMGSGRMQNREGYYDDK